MCRTTASVYHARRWPSRGNRLPKPIPLLICGDAVSCNSGLGRITRDIAMRIHEKMPGAFRLATLGVGGAGSRKYPWMQYHMQNTDQWQISDLPHAVTEHFDGEPGICFFIGDAARYGWLVHPESCTIPSLGQWLIANSGRFQKWLYTPVDADSIDGAFPKSLCETLSHFDRVLNYTEWSSKVTGYPDHLPHGIDTSVFRPHPRSQAKAMFQEMGFTGLQQDSLLLAFIGTNQLRKNWPLAFETASLLLRDGLDVRIWAHCDDLRRHYDIPTLLSEFGLSGRNAVTLQTFDDETLAWLNSAVDVNLQPSLGEGWGYNLAESLACGTPVVHGRYAGGVEIVPDEMLVDPIAWQYDGAHAWRRPVFDARHWADKVLEVRGREVSLPERYDWNVLWPRWQQWLEAGVNDHRLGADGL